MPGAPQPNETFCLICGTLGGVDFIGNIGLFVPLGLALRAAGLSARSAIALGALLSLGIESLQWVFIPGRDASLGDLVANTVGTAVGVVVVGWWRTLVEPAPQEARRLAEGGTFILLCLALVGAWSLRPAPIDLRYFSQWQPVRHGYSPFGGRVVGLRIQGRPRVPAEAIDPYYEPASVARGLLEVEATVVPGDVPRGTALVARLANPLGQAFELAQRGDALLYRSRRNSARVALRTPVFALEGAFPSQASSELRTLCASTEARSVTLCSREGGGATRSLTIPVTLGMAWQALSPLEVRLPWLLGAGAALLLAMAFFPITYWIMMARLTWSVPWVISLGVALLWAIPRLEGISPGGTWELLGTALGVAVAMAVSLRPSSTLQSSGALLPTLDASPQRQ